MNRRLLIIQPSHYISKSNHTVLKSRMKPLVPLGLPYLAALTPEGWDITLVDEQLQEIPFASKPDVVAITTWTMHSIRAYDVAAEFRKRGIPVIMGGPHVWFDADEAAEHCDAVGIGEGEPIWARMLEDAVNGTLQKIYRAPQMPSLAGLPLPRWDMLDLKKYGAFKTYSLLSSRGCPMQCEFCSERLYLGGGYRVRPTDEVVEDVKHTELEIRFLRRQRFRRQKRARAMELMEAMIPLKVRWSALWTSNLCDDKEFMDLARRSGLLHVNLGIESINPDTLKEMNKKFNKVSRYSELLANLRKGGISYSLNFIFGWDNETPEVFRSTLDFLEQERSAGGLLQHPHPGKGNDVLRKDDEGGPRRETGRDRTLARTYLPPSKPKYLASPEDIVRNVQGMYREFYSWKSMVRRLPLPLTEANIASWVVKSSRSEKWRSFRPELTTISTRSS